LTYGAVVKMKISISSLGDPRVIINDCTKNNEICTNCSTVPNKINFVPKKLILYQNNEFCTKMMKSIPNGFLPKIMKSLPKIMNSEPIKKLYQK
jgi:hypothetical protein